ncbi:MAG: bacteriocin biosynthesis protein, partial [Actinomycetaceae bacterium]
QVHYKSSSMALQQQFRSWPSAPRVRLPEPPLERLDGEAGEPVVELSAEHLSLLLTIGAGLQGRTDERVFRWTAAGGNIGSVLAYVVVRRCAGLTPGIYAWLPTTGELARVGDDPATVPGRAPTTIVLTGDFLKVASKYKAFGLRILLLDSGCAQTSFQRVAHRLGLPMTRRSRWDDVGVLDAVDADPQHEPVTAVIDLGGTP